MGDDHETGGQAQPLLPPEGRPEKAAAADLGLVSAQHHRPGGATRDDGAARMRLSQCRLRRAAAEYRQQVARLAAGEVDEVRVRDLRDRHRVVGRLAIPDEDRGGHGPEGGEVGLTAGRPALEDGLAIRPRGRWHYGHARPVAAGRRQQRSVHLVHCRGELAGSNQGDDPVHGGRVYLSRCGTFRAAPARPIGRNGLSGPGALAMITDRSSNAGIRSIG